MIAKVDWVLPKGVSEGDLYEFKMAETIQLPVLSDRESKTETTFLQGGKVSGTPALIRLTEPNTGKKQVFEGVLVKDAEGIYAIPKKFVDKNVTPLLETVQNSVDKASDEAKEIFDQATTEVDKVDTEKLFGFTKKQLLVMAITTIVLVKILK